MKVRFSRAFAVILAILLVLQPISVCAWWIDGGGAVGGMSPEQDDSTVIKTGECGENLTYTLKASGNLFISGTGPMYDYEEYSAPWRSFAWDHNVNVYFDSGATYIGQHAFSGCYNLREVCFPDTLQEIGSDAFNGSGKLRSISLPEGLTTIGARAFVGCGHPGYDGYEFNRVVLPSTLKSIGAQAFYMCPTLSTIVLPDGLEYIGNYAFGCCYALTEMIVPDSVTYLGENVFNSCNSLRTLRLPDTLEVLPKDLLSCTDSSKSSVTTITLPRNLKTIESKALECRELKEIHIPGNVESIAEDAFTIFSGTIYFSGDAPSFDPNTFRHNGMANSVTISYPDNNATWNAVVGQNFGGNVTWVPTHYHSYKATVTAPTCVSQGYTTYLCDCNLDVYIADYVDATGVHTYENGSCTVCGDTPAPVTIITQPESAVAAMGDRFAITVEAQGEDLTYQWFYKDKGMSDFAESVVKKSVYSFEMVSFRVGRQYYCEITDQYGNTVRTETVKSTTDLSIVTQPQNVEVSNGEKVSITVGAVGEDLSYQWYYKNKNGTSFAPSSYKGKTYSVTMSESNHGRQVYCVITDANGNTVTTETVTMTRPPVELEIVTQPQDGYAAMGEKFLIAVEAKGDGLTYQWYYKDPAMKNFEASAVKKASYSFEMVSFRNGRLYYCEITDMYGNTITTDIVGSYVAEHISCD